jgi:hypothetical protein
VATSRTWWAVLLVIGLWASQALGDEAARKITLSLSLTSGKTQTVSLTDVSTVGIEVGGTGYFLRWSAVKTLERAPGGIWKLALSGGEATDEAKVTDTGAFAVEGAWGTVRIGWDTISKVAVTDTGGPVPKGEPAQGVTVWEAQYKGSLTQSLWHLGFVSRAGAAPWGDDYLKLPLLDKGFRTWPALTAVQSLAAGAAQGTLLASLVGGEALLVSPDVQEVHAESPLGQTRIPIANVITLKQTSPLSPLEPPKAPTWRCVSTDDMSLDLEKPTLDLTCTTGAFTCRPDLDLLQGLQAGEGGSLLLELAGGTKLPVSLPAGNHTLKGASRLGDASIAVDHIKLLQRLMPRAPLSAQTPWRITPTEGSPLDVVDCVTPKATVGGFPLTEVNWSAVSGAARAPDGKALLARPPDGLAAQVEGTVNGRLPWGTYIVDCNKVATIARTGPAPEMPAVKVIGAVRGEGGIPIPVSSLELKTKDDDQCPEEDVRLITPTHDWWVAIGLLTRGGFERPEGNLVIKGAAILVSGKPDDRSTVSAVCSCGKLEAPLGAEALLGYAPATPEATKAGEVTGGTVLGITGADGSEAKLKVSQIEFADYPDRCWSGSYYSWPFHWYRQGALDVDTAEGRVTVRFPKLAKLTVVDSYRDRKVHLLARSGDEMDATVYPGSTNQEAKSGPYSWDINREGLLCTLGDAQLQAYIPFKRIKEITFE